MYENTEIYLIVSENIANDSTKLEKYISNIENLSKKILNANAKTKIGIIGITGTIKDLSYDENGKLVVGDKDQTDVVGSNFNAEIVVNLTDNVDTIRNGLKNMNSSKNTYNTNLQAAIKLASQSYSNETNKILVSVYDDVPNIAIGVEMKIEYGGIFNEYKTAEEAVIAKHEKISTNTRNEILRLKNYNISFILLRPDDTSYDETWYSMTTGEKLLDFDGSAYVNKLYGTIEKPTYGKMYSFTDSTVDNIIRENIYQDIESYIQPNIRNVKIVDYFPKDVIDNFDIIIEGNPSIGIVTNNINEGNNNTLEWNIGTLNGNEIATLRYKLKIKNIRTEELFNKIIDTNEKVELLYTDVEDKENTVILSSSPKIKLTRTEMNEANDQKEDKTVSTETLPKTGVNRATITVIVLVILVSIIAYKKYRSFRDIK